jgi:hypothetical protein
MASASAPGAETLAPTINVGGTVNTIVAGTASVVTITGNALEGASLELTTVAGDIIAVAADSSDVASLTATINVPVGVYAMRAVIADETSNPIVIAVMPAVMISSGVCAPCSADMDIYGSGFGDSPPAGSGDYLNVSVDGVEVEIVKWTDTKIKVRGTGCSYDEIIVNALTGSATN